MVTTIITDAPAIPPRHGQGLWDKHEWQPKKPGLSLSSHLSLSLLTLLCCLILCQALNFSFCGILYHFPIVAVANHHKHSGLQTPQTYCITVLVVGTAWVPAGLCSLVAGLSGEPALSLQPLEAAACIPSLVALLLLQSQPWQLQSTSKNATAQILTLFPTERHVW